MGLALLLAAFLTSTGHAAEPGQVTSDTATLKKADVASDGASLVEFFRRRIANDSQEETIKKHIELLGDRKFSNRRKAMDDLLKIGPPAMAQLEQALVSSNDIEVQKRAEELIGALKTMSTSDLLAAAVRLLAHHKPDGATAVLIDYLPNTSDMYVIDEIRYALQTVSVKKEKDKATLDEAVIKGLEEKNDIKRSAAAEVVARFGDAEQRKKAKELLKDKSALVRHRVALGLLDHQDKDAVPVLIKLLTEIDRAQIWTIEEVLVHIAGEKAPRVSLGKTDDERAKFAKGWSEWWDNDGAKAAIPKLDPASRMLGFTLVCNIDNGKINMNGYPLGRVAEIDQNKKVRWSLDNLNYPTDAVMLNSNKVALLEMNNTLRIVSTTGEELFKKQLPTTYYGIQKLNNGNIFCQSRYQVCEFDSSGKEISTVNFNQGGGVGARSMIYSATKAPNGDIVTIQRNIQNRTSEVVRYDSAGKELKRFDLKQQTVTTMMRFDVLPNGNVIVPFYSMNKVIEYDGEGKSVWEASVTQPTSAQRLPNGRTFIGSRYSRYAIEVDRDGKEVWRYTEEGVNSQLIQARRR